MYILWMFIRQETSFFRHPPDVRVLFEIYVSLILKFLFDFYFLLHNSKLSLSPSLSLSFCNLYKITSSRVSRQASGVD